MSAVDEDLAVLPRVWDELWAEHGPAIRAAQLAVVEAQARTEAEMGGPE
jgi:hypothetical protein